MICFQLIEEIKAIKLIVQEVANLEFLIHTHALSPRPCYPPEEPKLIVQEVVNLEFLTHAHALSPGPCYPPEEPKPLVRAFFPKQLPPYLGLDVIPGDDVTHCSQGRRGHFVVIVPTEEGDLISTGPAALSRLQSSAQSSRLLTAVL